MEAAPSVCVLVRRFMGGLEFEDRMHRRNSAYTSQVTRGVITETGTIKVFDRELERKLLVSKPRSISGSALTRDAAQSCDYENCGPSQSAMILCRCQNHRHAAYRDAEEYGSVD